MALRPSHWLKTQRLLDVDVLARLAAPNRRQAVPVVGRGNHDRIDRLVVEGLAEVLDAHRIFAALGGDSFQRGGKKSAIDVADVRDAAVGPLDEAGGEVAAAAADAHHRQHDAVVGRGCPHRLGVLENRQSGGCA